MLSAHGIRAGTRTSAHFQRVFQKRPKLDRVCCYRRAGDGGRVGGDRGGHHGGRAAAVAAAGGQKAEGIVNKDLWVGYAKP